MINSGALLTINGAHTSAVHMVFLYLIIIMYSIWGNALSDATGVP
ncbi:hypothetical protein [Vibrio sp. SS-MA-C1-2]|nr:hypothetical protein [Vibrio sp. SS-MA-C1-2]